MSYDIETRTKATTSMGVISCCSREASSIPNYTRINATIECYRRNMSVGGWVGNSVCRSVGMSEIRAVLRSLCWKCGMPVRRYVVYSVYRLVGPSEIRCVGWSKCRKIRDNVRSLCQIYPSRSVSYICLLYTSPSPRDS